MITVWEVYRLMDDGDFAHMSEHVRYYPYRELNKALEHWKSAGGFPGGYGLRLALAKPEWMNREEK